MIVKKGVLSVFCKRNTCDFIRGYRVYDERHGKPDVMSTKLFECDSYASDYVFAHCRDMIDLMRRGVWVGEV